MTATPRITLVAYESREPGRVFVMVPDQRGRYMLVERCVVEVACDHCGSDIGEPCKSQHGYIINTHVKRRLSWWVIKPRLRDMHEAHDLIKPKPHVKLVLKEST